jgi:hypothetical protein
VSAQSIAINVDVLRQILYKREDKLLSQNYSDAIKQKGKAHQTEDITELQEKIDGLQRYMYELQLEHDILKKANELLKKDNGISHKFLTNPEKTILIDALLSRYRLKELLSSVELPRSSYFYHRARLRLPDKYKLTRKLISDIFNLNRQCYGY